MKKQTWSGVNYAILFALIFLKLRICLFKEFWGKKLPFLKLSLREQTEEMTKIQCLSGQISLFKTTIATSPCKNVHGTSGLIKCESKTHTCTMYKFNRHNCGLWNPDPEMMPSLSWVSSQVSVLSWISWCLTRYKIC